MRKSPRTGYWYQRDKNSRSQDYGSAGNQRANNSDAQNQQIALARQHQSSVNILTRKSAQLQNNLQKITKIEDFYQIMCSGQFAQVGVRCYQHNNQLILYCMNDHKLLCPNCMYTNNPNPNLIQEIEKNNKSDKKKRSRPLNNPNTGVHSTHDVRQIVKCSAQISNDVKMDQFQAKQSISLINSCRLGWQKMKQNFDKIRQSILNELDKEYDKLQQQISSRYLQIKKQLNAVSQQYNTNLQKIITSYKIISKLIIPSRYPIITVKHSWLDRVKNNILPDVQTTQPSIAWLKCYEGHSKMILKKIQRKVES